jgi:hypothetical protein
MTTAARITMVSQLENGYLMVVTPDMKVWVKIAADGLDGGVIPVNNQNASPAGSSPTASAAQ